MHISISISNLANMVQKAHSLVICQHISGLELTFVGMVILAHNNMHTGDSYIYRNVFFLHIVCEVKNNSR